MSDEILDDLYSQKEGVDARIRLRKKDIAKESGLIVDSIDDLFCDRHEGARVIAVGTIKDSIKLFIKDGKAQFEGGLNIYKCETCEGEDFVRLPKGYDCNFCGIVVGNFETRSYRSPQESWNQLAGREGEHYHCTVCDDQLGSFYWLVS